MAKKKKILKLNDRQYYEYIMSLKDDAALYDTNGKPFVPEEIEKEKNKKEK